jgi:hemoglobin
VKPDLDSPERIHAFIDAFYARVLADPVLAPIFLDVAAVDLAKHLPHIRAYWEKLILGREGYRRHTMNIHRALHAKKTLEPAEFERWVALFEQAIDEGYAGARAERARAIARAIAKNMQASL